MYEEQFGQQASLGNSYASATTSVNFLSTPLSFLRLNLVGTPGSDILVGERETDNIPYQVDIEIGRTGSDRLIGVNPADATPGQGEIDLLIGGPESTDPNANTPSNNLFILGDYQKSYYTGGTGLFGSGDFAFIGDFKPENDAIRLHGSASNYFLTNFSLGNTTESGIIGTAIFQNGSTPDLIAILYGVSDLSLDADYFEFVNSPPPSETRSQVQQLGTPGVDQAFDIITDSEGNAYITGFTTGDLSEPNAGSKDAFFAKYDNAGNLLWTRQLGTEAADTSFGIAGDYIYITGSSAGSFAAPNTGGPDIYVAKYDTDGNLLETTQIGTDGLDRSYGITTDNAGNVYISGYTVGDLGGINNNSEQFLATTDTYVAKFDSDLKLQWITQFGTTEYDDTYGIAIDSGGNLFTTGWTQGDLYGTNAGLYDVTLAKVDNLGNLLWTRQFGTSGYDFAWDVATDSFGNVYTTGYTTGDLAEANAGFYDVFLAKYDTDGNQQWIQQIGTSGSDNAFGIDIDSNNTIYLTGFTTGDLGGVNAGGDSAGADDAFWAAFDMDGNMLDIQQFGTSGVDRAFGIDVQIPGQVYLTGFTDGSLGQANAGSLDAWISVESASVLGCCEGCNRVASPDLVL